MAGAAPEGAVKRLASGEYQKKVRGEWVRVVKRGDDFVEPTMADRVRAAIPTVDEAAQGFRNATERMIGPTAEIANVATFGANIPMAAALQTPTYMATMGVGPGEAYDAAYARYRAPLEEYRERSPVGSMATGIGAGLASGGGLGFLAQRTLSNAINSGLAQNVLARFLGATGRGEPVASQVGQGIAAGAAQGAISAASEGLPAGEGGMFGGTIGALTGIPQVMLNPRAVPDRAPTTAGPGGELLPLPYGTRDDGTGRSDYLRFPLTEGEVRYRDSQGRDPSVLRQEQRARSGLMGPDAALEIADYEFGRDDYILRRIGSDEIEDMPRAGDSGALMADGILSRASSLEAAKTAAYEALDKYQPFISREDLASIIESARMQLFDPPDAPGGLGSSLSPETVAKMPAVSGAMDLVDSFLNRVAPVRGMALPNPSGATRFGVGEIENLRRALQGLARDTQDDNQARIIKGAVRRLDTLYDEAFESGAIQSSQGDPIEFREALRRARQANRSFMDLADGRLRPVRGSETKRPISKLVQGLQTGRVSEDQVVNALVTSTGRPKGDSLQLLRELDELAPDAAFPARLGIAARLFGKTITFAEEQPPIINDRRAFISRLDSAVSESPEFYRRAFGDEWVSSVRSIVDETQPARVDVMRGGNRFNTENPTGSGDQAVRLAQEALMASASSGASAGAGIIKGAYQRFQNNRQVRQVMDGILREVRPYQDALPPELVAAFAEAARRAAIETQRKDQ